MSALITPVKAARKRYHCSWDCGTDIEPGQPYVRCALPPWTGANESEHWWSLVAHGRFPEQCPTFIGAQDPPAARAEIEFL